MAPKTPSPAVTAFILLILAGLAMTASSVGTAGRGRVSTTREEIEADPRQAANEAVIVKAKDKNLRLAWITGRTAVRGAQIVAFRCKSPAHVDEEAAEP